MSNAGLQYLAVAQSFRPEKLEPADMVRAAAAQVSMKPLFERSARD